VTVENNMYILRENLHDFADEIESGVPPRRRIVARLRELAGPDPRTTHVGNRYVLDGQGLADMLSLVCVTVPPAQLAAWTSEQREQAINWAVAVHLDASDNDVTVPPRPEFLPK
jgi:hypothetical protein